MNLDFLGGTIVVSLYAELEQYRDTICISCKERVLLAAGSTTRYLQQSAISSSRDTVNTLRSLPGHTDIIAALSDVELPVHPSIIGDEPSSPLAASVEGNSDNSFHSAPQPIPNSPNITPDLPLPPTFPVPVEYNPEIKRTLDLSVVSTFAVPAGVQSAAFNQDGRFLLRRLIMKKHIFDMTTMSKR
jgi:hypothetical protein